MSSFEIKREKSHEKVPRKSQIPKPQRKPTGSSNIRLTINPAENSSKPPISIKSIKAKLLSSRVSATSDATTESRVQPWTSPYLAQKYKLSAATTISDETNERVSTTQSQLSQSESKADKKGKQMLTTLDDFPPILGDCLESIIIPGEDAREFLESFDAATVEKVMSKFKEYNFQQNMPVKDDKAVEDDKYERHSMFRQLYEGATGAVGMMPSKGTDQSIEKNKLKVESCPPDVQHCEVNIKKDSGTKLQTVITNFDYPSNKYNESKNSNNEVHTEKEDSSCGQITADQTNDRSKNDIKKSSPLEQSFERNWTDLPHACLDERIDTPMFPQRINKDACDLTTCDTFAKVFGQKRRKFCCENGLCPINDPTTSTYKFLLATRLCCNTRGCQLAAKICDLYEPLVTLNEEDEQLTGDQKYHYLSLDASINEDYLVKSTDKVEDKPPFIERSSSMNQPVITSVLVKISADAPDVEEEEEKEETKPSTENINEIVNPLEQDLSEIANIQGARRRTSTVSWIEPSDIAAIHSKSQEEVITRATAEADKFRQTPLAIKHGSVFGDIMRKKLEDEPSVVLAEHEPTVVKSQVDSIVMHDHLNDKPICCPKLRAKFRKNRKPEKERGHHSDSEGKKRRKHPEKKQLEYTPTEKEELRNRSNSRHKQHRHRHHKRSNSDRQVQVEDQTQQDTGDEGAFGKKHLKKVASPIQEKKQEVNNLLDKM